MRSLELSRQAMATRLRAILSSRKLMTAWRDTLEFARKTDCIAQPSTGSDAGFGGGGSALIDKILKYLILVSFTVIVGIVLILVGSPDNAPEGEMSTIAMLGGITLLGSPIWAAAFVWLLNKAPSGAAPTRKKSTKRKEITPQERAIGLSSLPERFVVFDLETTGLKAGQHEIIEIGAIRVNRDSNQHETFSALVMPEGHFIPTCINHNSCAHWRRPMVMMRDG